MGVYGDPMSWFQIGQATAPTAGLGNAIRGVLDLHNKFAIAAGGKAFEAMMPSEQAKTNLYNAQSSFYRGFGGGGEGEWTIDPFTNMPTRTTRTKSGPKTETADTGRAAAIKAWLDQNPDGIPNPITATVDEVQKFNNFIQNWQTTMTQGRLEGGVVSKPSMWNNLGNLGRGIMSKFQPAKATFNSYEEAINSGLPTGTIVTIGGKQYRLAPD